MRKVLSTTTVVLALVVTPAASATIIPYTQIDGVRLGTTVSQAKHALGPSCPTLTRGNRSRLRCYFTIATGPGVLDLHYQSLAKRCGADVSFQSGHAVEVIGGCNDALPNGVGIGSTFKRMYSSFPRGTVRCAAQSIDGRDTCIAQRSTRDGTFLTLFGDDQFRPGRTVAVVTVKKCSSVEISHTPPPGRPEFLSCKANFLTTQGRVPGEFTP
jgi:hypothetical protein